MKRILLHADVGDAFPSVLRRYTPAFRRAPAAAPVKNKWAKRAGVKNGSVPWRRRQTHSDHQIFEKIRRALRLGQSPGIPTDGEAAI